MNAYVPPHSVQFSQLVFNSLYSLKTYTQSMGTCETDGKVEPVLRGWFSPRSSAGATTRRGKGVTLATLIVQDGPQSGGLGRADPGQRWVGREGGKPQLSQGCGPRAFSNPTTLIEHWPPGKAI